MRRRDGLFVFRGGFVFRRRETAAASAVPEQGEERKVGRMDGWKEVDLRFWYLGVVEIVLTSFSALPSIGGVTQLFMLNS